MSKTVRFVALFSLSTAAAALTTGIESGCLVLAAATLRFLGFALGFNEDRKKACKVTPFIDRVMFLAAVLGVVSLATELREEFAVPAVVLSFIGTFLVLEEEEAECSEYYGSLA